MAGISENLITVVPKKSLKFKVLAVVTVRNKNKEYLKEKIVKHLDAFTNKNGRNVALKLINTDIDPSSTLRLDKVVMVVRSEVSRVKPHCLPISRLLILWSIPTNTRESSNEFAAGELDRCVYESLRREATSLRIQTNVRMILLGRLTKSCGPLLFQFRHDCVGWLHAISFDSEGRQKQQLLFRFMVGQ
ncbi:hypothetical protein BC332_29997 [Capsicum chinense]|nr:hypothetical protein BC332_29997 [Capsicum chinense]